jgi:molybdopterin-guanine dinucleotide biosynthesis protein A
MITLIIQAGGQSRRMGENKAIKLFLGEPLILRVLSRVAHLADEVIITTNAPEDLQFLQLPLIRDVLPGNGALGGIYSGLLVAKFATVIVVGCDMPFVNVDLLVAEVNLLKNSEADAVIPKSGVSLQKRSAGLEPLHAVYQRDRCLPAVFHSIQQNRLRLTDWLGAVTVREMSPEEVIVYDPDFLAFQNVNTPREFEEAENLARRKN